MKISIVLEDVEGDKIYVGTVDDYPDVWVCDPRSIQCLYDLCCVIEFLSNEKIIPKYDHSWEGRYSHPPDSKRLKQILSPSVSDDIAP